MYEILPDEKDLQSYILSLYWQFYDHSCIKQFYRLFNEAVNAATKSAYS